MKLFIKYMTKLKLELMTTILVKQITPTLHLPKIHCMCTVLKKNSKIVK